MVVRCVGVGCGQRNAGGSRLTARPCLCDGAQRRGVRQRIGALLQGLIGVGGCRPVWRRAPEGGGHSCGSPAPVATAPLLDAPPPAQ